MKTLQKEEEKTGTSLNHLVSSLLETFQPAAVKQNSLLVNDVPEQLLVFTDEHLLAALIGDLFSNVISNSKDCCIRISARTYQDTILLHIRDNSVHDTEAEIQSFEELQCIAERLGGSIHFNQFSKNCNTLTLSFLNASFAA